MERKEQIKDREREAWRLRLLGYTQERIAAQLGVEQPAICKALARTERRLAQQFAAEALQIKGRQTAQLELLYAEAMKQWARSCDDAEKVTTISGRTKVFDDGAAVTLPDLCTVTRQGQSGNPALLAQAMKALADIRSIWGLDSPVKQEISGAAGGPVAIREVVVELLQERMQRLAEATDAAEADL